MKCEHQIHGLSPLAKGFIKLLVHNSDKNDSEFYYMSAGLC